MRRILQVTKQMNSLNNIDSLSPKGGEGTNGTY